MDWEHIFGAVGIGRWGEGIQGVPWTGVGCVVFSLSQLNIFLFNTPDLVLIVFGWEGGGKCGTWDMKMNIYLLDITPGSITHCERGRSAAGRKNYYVFFWAQEARQPERR
jgi:hypothetical protein